MAKLVKKIFPGTKLPLTNLKPLTTVSDRVTCNSDAQFCIHKPQLCAKNQKNLMRGFSDLGITNEMDARTKAKP